MKFNKKSAKHWYRLIIFTVFTALSTALRKLKKKNTEGLIILYGHKLNGNLKSLYDANQKDARPLKMYYTTMDYEYYKELKNNGIKVILATSPKIIATLCNTKCIISDHGLHSLELLLEHSDIKFVDVWHGIPFKGFDKNDFKTQHKYDEVWVSSELLKNIYIDKFGFRREIVKVTGYGRTDTTLNSLNKSREIKESLRIPQDKKVILFAPTWKQDSNGRSIYPFGSKATEFKKIINDICESNNAIAIFRVHLNSKTSTQDSNYIYNRPHALHPDTESLLSICDLLICDWSSIAFDYLILNRPTIFLDVHAPFNKGFSLGPEYRFGDIVRSTKSLQVKAINYLQSPKDYHEKYKIKNQGIINTIWGDSVDGKTANRYINRLKKFTSPEHK